jgi:DNA repair exonuclease SbcCD nuclease subunit
MKILFIGDMHLLINKFELATTFLKWIDGFIEEQRPDVVVNLGDALDTHAVIRSEILNELMSHIYRVVDRGVPYVYLKGNHDQASPKDGRYHAMLPFKGRIKNLHVVDEPQDLFGITFVPFIAHPKDFPRKTLPICVAHQTFLGADYGAINAAEGLDAEEVSADIIISGHIHKRHDLGKVVYVGSPYSQDASDVNQVKGISIFDTDTFGWQFFQTPMPTWRAFKFEIDAQHSVKDLHVGLSQTLDSSSDHWVLDIKGPKAELVTYLDSKEYRELVKGNSIRLKASFTDKEKKKVSIAAVSMGQIVQDYINKVYNGSLDKTVLLSEATAILSDLKVK